MDESKNATEETIETEVLNEDALNEEILMDEEIIEEQYEETEDVTEEVTEELNDASEKNINTETEVDKLAREKADLLDKLQRQIAEFDNFRKRTIKEKASMYDDGVCDTVEKLLPVIDNFSRAMETTTNKEDSLYKGIEMIYNQFVEILTSLGVEEIQTVGEQFDANFHFAVQHEENEEFGENTISLEMQKGYKYKEKVIRPSMVKVAN